MTGYWNVGVMLAHGPDVFCKAVTHSPFSFSNVEQATLGAEAVSTRKLETVNMVEGIREIADVGGQGLDKWREDGLKVKFGAADYNGTTFVSRFDNKVRVGPERGIQAQVDNEILSLVLEKVLEIPHAQ
eukprot:g38292.t1